MNEPTKEPQKELMIHVERIVRPVRAGESRKVRMRRELLAHLTAALDEERAHEGQDGGQESEALERAKRRIGEPAEITRQMQQSVPWIERTLLAKLPAPKILNRWEERSEREWGFPTMLQAAVVSSIVLVFALMALGLAAPIPEARRQAFFVMGNEDHTRFVLTWLAGAFLVNAMVWLVLAHVVKFLRSSRATPAVVTLSAAIIFAQTAWVLLVKSQIVRQAPGVGDVLRGLAGGTLIVVVNALTAFIFRRMGNASHEWKQLDLAN